jgi:hypothetical protein
LDEAIGAFQGIERPSQAVCSFVRNLRSIEAIKDEGISVPFRFAFVIAGKQEGSDRRAACVAAPCPSR